MIDNVQQHLRRLRLVKPMAPLWIAVSGGVDSMVLLHVMHRLGHPCHVIHVDHGLRGAESDADRAFVEEHCKAMDVPCRVPRVDVETQAAASGESVQMVARTLRYEAFARAVADGPATLALAHHRDDALETFFIHLLRGMGLHGWETIPPRSGAYVRPLLSVDRAEIEAYALEHAIPFRTDSSNTDPKYLRNRVRNELLPLLEDLRPGAHRVLARNVELFRELDNAAQQHVEQVLQSVLTDADGTVRMSIELIVQSGTPLLVLHQLLAERDPHPDRLADILRAMEEGAIGKHFPLGDVVVLVDRKDLVVHRSTPALDPWIIPSLHEMPDGLPISLELCAAERLDRKAGPTVAWLDADTLQYPLELRTWQPGDRMRPVGLGGSKLISDILIDAKVPRDRKAKCMVLVSGGVIVWLVGHRVGEDFAAGDGSTRVVLSTWNG